MGFFSKKKTEDEIVAIARKWLDGVGYPFADKLNATPGVGNTWDARAYFDRHRSQEPLMIVFAADGSFIEPRPLGHMN